ncbi:MoaD/ThiS family protein [Nocardioides zeae]|uniref:Molybdopterin synthase sulfur carrier subunit n=1 Tax=Nocardioides zeae TaxID=1457234 RepID=A0AAJ1U9B2_9ACTN|nr:MoaD/ThiS family protein [Nocardioides zeae]MDQ1105912.1 molybdopterin synthase sulfur carrier subunit [Nocardioides zeae]
MARLLLFATARDAAGTTRDAFDVATLGELMTAARDRYGAPFARVLPGCRVWVNGEDVADDRPLAVGDEVAVIPPVAGG